MFKDEEAAEREGLQVENAGLRAENARLRAEVERLKANSHQEFSSGLKMNELAANALEEKGRMRADLQAAEAKRATLKKALEALLEVSNNILSIEDGGKNYIADLAVCKRELVLPALAGEKCGHSGPAGLLCEREAGHTGNHMGDLSKAYPNQKKKCRCPNYISTTDGKCNACGLEA